MHRLYLFLGFAIGAWAPYAALYLKGIGLSDAQIGTLLAVSPLVGLVAQPNTGALADRLGPVRVLSWLLPAAGIAALGVRAAGTNPWLLAVGLGAMAVTMGAAFPLTDSLALTTIQRQGGLYGRMRIGATIGYIGSVAMAGYTYQWFGIGLIFAWLPLGLMLNWWGLRRSFPDGGPLPPPRARRAGAMTLLRSPIWPLALLAVITLQMANAAHGLYFAIYLTELGAGAGLAGLAWAAAALSEIPAMWYLGPTIARVGPLFATALAAAVYALRYLLLSAANTPLEALSTQLLHSVSFGVAGQALVMLAAELAPKDLQSTAQGLMAGVGYGVAAVIGSAGAGLVVQAAGMPALFRLAGALALLAAAGFAALALRRRRAPLPLPEPGP